MWIPCPDCPDFRLELDQGDLDIQTLNVSGWYGVDFRGPYSRQQLTGRQFQCTETYDETTKNDHADFIQGPKNGGDRDQAESSS